MWKKQQEMGQKQWHTFVKWGIYGQAPTATKICTEMPAMANSCLSNGERLHIMVKSHGWLSLGRLYPELSRKAGHQRMDMMAEPIRVKGCLDMWPAAHLIGVALDCHKVFPPFQHRKQYCAACNPARGSKNTTPPKGPFSVTLDPWQSFQPQHSSSLRFCWSVWERMAEGVLVPQQWERNTERQEDVPSERLAMYFYPLV